MKSDTAHAMSFGVDGLLEQRRAEMTDHANEAFTSHLAEAEQRVRDSLIAAEMYRYKALVDRLKPLWRDLAELAYRGLEGEGWRRGEVHDDD